MASVRVIYINANSCLHSNLLGNVESVPASDINSCLDISQEKKNQYSATWLDLKEKGAMLWEHLFQVFMLFYYLF